MAENRSFCLLEWPPGEGGALEVQQLKETESGVSLIIGVQVITLIKKDTVCNQADGPKSKHMF
jgi:hypothetical protein